MKSESEIQQIIQMEAMKYGCTLMRNNSGALTDNTGRLVRYGLGNISKSHSDKIKSSDLIGITTITITPEMVGKKIGVFTAIEVKEEKWNKNKKPDKREIAQAAFIQWVLSKGGIGFFANGIDILKDVFGNIGK